MASQISKPIQQGPLKNIMKYQDIVDIATELNKNDVVNRDKLVLEYKFSPIHHKKMNEELFIVTGQYKTQRELVYHDEIELTVLNVNFRFIKDE